MQWVESRLEIASTLADAVARLSAERFDLVVTDLNLPDSAGPGDSGGACACRRARDHRAHRRPEPGAARGRDRVRRLRSPIQGQSQRRRAGAPGAARLDSGEHVRLAARERGALPQPDGPVLGLLLGVRRRAPRGQERARLPAPPGGESDAARQAALGDALALPGRRGLGGAPRHAGRAPSVPRVRDRAPRRRRRGALALHQRRAGVRRGRVLQRLPRHRQGHHRAQARRGGAAALPAGAGYVARHDPARRPRQHAPGRREHHHCASCSATRARSCSRMGPTGHPAGEARGAREDLRRHDRRSVGRYRDAQLLPLQGRLAAAVRVDAARPAQRRALDHRGDLARHPRAHRGGGRAARERGALPQPDARCRRTGTGSRTRSSA